MQSVWLLTGSEKVELRFRVLFQTGKEKVGNNE